MFIHNTPAAYYGRSIKITLEILEKWYPEFNNTIEEFQKYLLVDLFVLNIAKILLRQLLNG
ncbi:unnamed protein product, partial [Adineta steineri]